MKRKINIDNASAFYDAMGDTPEELRIKPFTKAEQLGRKVKTTKAEKDKAMRLLIELVYFYIYGSDFTDFFGDDLHHIKGKKAYPELRYIPSNLVFLTREEHTKAHNAEFDIQRPERITKLLKQLDPLFLEAE